VANNRGYRLLLSERVRGMSVAEAFDYIDAIQSFRGDWPLALSPSAALEAEKLVELESLTPIPATHGALAFVEFYADEEGLASSLAGKLGVSPEVLRSALERGVPLHRLAPPEVVEELEGVGEHLRAFLFEAAVPLGEGDVRGEALASLEWVTDFEVVEVEVPGLDPEVVERELERSQYVGEYMQRLERLFARAETRARRLLLVRGEGESRMRLIDVEALMAQVVERVPALRVAVMYNRLLPPL
jgi:hypothetical protein